MKRSVILLVFLVGSLGACAIEDGPACEVDPDCGDGTVCTRSGECALPADVRSVDVRWTVRGAPASPSTCASNSDLYIDFIGDTLGDLASFDPVACATGQFFVDKLDRRFGRVEIGVDGHWYDITEVRADGTAVLDLAPTP